MKQKISLLKSVWLLLLILLIMVGNGLPLAVLIPLFFIVLISPLIREFHPATDLDERQLQISHFSSHLAFYAFLVLLVIVMMRDFIAQGQNPPPWAYALLIIPLLVKVTISLYQNYQAERVAFWIGYGWFGVWFLFVVLSHGLSIEGLVEISPFLLLLVLILLFRKKILISGTIFILFAVGLTFFFRGWLRLDFYVRLLMYFLVPLPLLSSGVVLIWQQLKTRSAK
ncbi:hypothetical protein Calab_0409 [Caldithrix abyssi DSM 13497]|uniref:Uncharacterized protein n=1 Tax=Caldithrix abyssi DSM 13497 TaxID=880073 RepID=H1XQG7_CALAY|nr:hypothetical protein [Caldithrix abyssi]APF19965.1 hypothetical protein Cabys_3217 [Caldithrix abyssi DSM 13497]EHO40054.1 hypothetical protein Calab_0409 [Caldithrix abyssi DSM 13497]